MRGWAQDRKGRRIQTIGTIWKQKSSQEDWPKRDVGYSTGKGVGVQAEAQRHGEGSLQERRLAHAQVGGGKSKER